MRDHVSNSKTVTMIQPQSTTATTAITGNTFAASGGNTNGGIDTKGFRRLIVRLHAGAIAASSGIALKLQSSSDEGASDTYADITGAAIVALGDTDDNKCATIDLKLDGIERYVRAHLTPAGTGATVFCVSGVLADPIVKPVAQFIDAVVVNS